MKLNTNSNIYTVVYASVVVIVVAFLLAFVSSVLKAPSEANERIDKKKQILASLGIRGIANENVEAEYAKVIQADMIVDSKGNVLSAGNNKDADGFSVSRKDIGMSKLPIYICMLNGEKKYVIPLVGKGLWGTIWGYLALNDDCNTVFGAYFSHESETAGLGALITTEKFQDEFKGKKMSDGKGRVVLDVVKNGKVTDATTQCDGISGATLTMNGLKDMIHKYGQAYQPVLDKQRQ